MTGLFNFINGFFTALQAVLSWMLDGLLFVLKTALFFIWDGLLTSITSILHSVDVSQLIVSAAATWGALPPQLLWLVNQVGIPQGLTILGYAYAIRMTLNLIPAAFTRI